ncbi:MAG: hypothetical protein WCE63_21090 [Acidobacteriaceae bacterium]
MIQPLHILRKDARHLWIELALYAVLLTAFGVATLHTGHEGDACGSIGTRTTPFAMQAHKAASQPGRLSDQIKTQSPLRKSLVRNLALKAPAIRATSGYRYVQPRQPSS